jgi:hypothetical protein
MLKQIHDAVEAITNRASDAREQILLANATEQQLYEYRRIAANNQIAQLEQASDPAQIQSLSESAIQNVLAAFNALPVAQQQLEQQSFLGLIDYIEATTRERLEAAGEISQEQFQAMQQQLVALDLANTQRAEVLNETKAMRRDINRLIEIMVDSRYAA